MKSPLKGDVVSKMNFWINSFDIIKVRREGRGERIGKLNDVIYG